MPKQIKMKRAGCIAKEIEVRDACIKANPSIMELGLGCEIKISNESFAAATTGIDLAKQGLKILCKTIGGDSYLVLTRIGVETFTWRDIDRHCEILGRPIRLADVMLAIQETAGIEDWKKDIFVSAAGVFAEMEWSENDDLDKVKYHEIAWNLLEDSLEKQSPETLIFLANLLG